MITLSKKTEEKRTVFENGLTTEYVTYIQFDICDGENIVGSGTIRKGGAEMPVPEDMSISINCRGNMTPEEIYNNISVLFKN